MSGLWRLSIVHTVIVILVCLGLYHLTTSWIRDHDKSAVLSELERVAVQAAGQIEPDGVAVSSGIAAAFRGSSYRITLIRSDGRIVYDSMLDNATKAGQQSLRNRSELEQAWREGVGRAIRFSPTLGTGMAYAAVRVPQSSWILRVGRSYSGGNTELEFRLQLGFAVAGFLLIAGLLLAAFSANRHWKKYQRVLTQWSSRIAGGEFPQRLPLVTSRSMGPIARAMEKLAAGARAQIEGLEAARDHLNTVLSSMLEGVLVVDKRGRISDCNPAFREMFRIQSRPAGKLPLEVIRVASVADQISRVLENGERAWDEIQNDGRVLRVHFTPVGSDPPTGVVVVFNDISDLRRLEQLRKEFVSNVSHELKTPLTAIQGYAETLAGESELEPLYGQFLDKIIRNSQQLSAMIDQLLNLARIESQNQELALEKLDFNEILGQLQEEFQEALAAKHLEFRWSAPEQPWFVADRSYIYQVFRNLLENAIKYTETGEVVIRMEEGDGHWLFLVEDTGTGIPEKDLERIFERFYRVHKDRSRATGGSGIGLAIVKHIVQIHHGEVWAESRLNSGTRLFFTLPFPST